MKSAMMHRVWRSALLLRANGRRSLATAAAASKRLRVAVVGTGRMGEIRLAGLQQLADKVEIAAIIDASLTSSSGSSPASSYERRFNAPCFASISDATSELTTVDGVWVATPTPTHLQVIQQTLSVAPQLKAIGIEKPVAGTLSEIDEAYNACFARRVHLVCSFQRRFDPSYQSLWRQCVENKTLGALQSIHTVFRDHPCPPIEFLKTGGDPFHDLAVHDIDYVCSLVGEYPSKVYGYGTSLSQELQQVGVMDKASVWLEFARSGVVCTMDVSRRADYGYDQRIEVCGELGMLQVLNPPATSVVLSSGAGTEQRESAAMHSFPQRFREAYALEMAHFMRVVAGEEMPRVHWNAARMATVVAEAARVAATQRKVVTIKYDKTKQLDPRQDPYVDVYYEY